MNFEQYCAAIEAAFDATVEQGSDDELFMAGYLHGHFSLVVARCELDASVTITALQSAMQESLQQAFEKGELDGDDQQQVQRFWLGLQPA